MLQPRASVYFIVCFLWWINKKQIRLLKLKNKHKPWHAVLFSFLYSIELSLIQIIYAVPILNMSDSKSSKYICIKSLI